MLSETLYPTHLNAHWQLILMSIITHCDCDCVEIHCNCQSLVRLISAWTIQTLLLSRQRTSCGKSKLYLIHIVIGVVFLRYKA